MMFFRNGPILIWEDSLTSLSAPSKINWAHIVASPPLPASLPRYRPYVPTVALDSNMQWGLKSYMKRRTKEWKWRVKETRVSGCSPELGRPPLALRRPLVQLPATNEERRGWECFERESAKGENTSMKNDVLLAFSYIYFSSIFFSCHLLHQIQAQS